MDISNNHVTLVEVGPRDGLQNEKQTVATATKIELIQRLAQCGHSVVEATSFVSPKWVPQLADAAEVFTAIKDQTSDVRHPVLVPNLKGMQRALEVGVKEVALFTAASESFNQKNINCSIEESLQHFEPVIELAKENHIRIRGYISCVLGCPYEGDIQAAAVAAVTERMLALGCDEISLGDTIGVGTPGKAKAMLQAVLQTAPAQQLAVHYHDTYGQALANILASLELDIRIVDASIAGLGGCPYAQGASGNVATEDVVYMLHGLGLETGLDLNLLAETGQWISKQLQRPNMSRAGIAIYNKNHKA